MRLATVCLISNVTSTLVFLIIVQDGIYLQVGNFSKTNKRAGWNKAVQGGIFQKLLLWTPFSVKNFKN